MLHHRLREWRAREYLLLLYLLGAVLPHGACLAADAVATSTPSAAADSAAPTFDINEFRVLGNTVLGEVDIDGAVYRYLGPAKTITDVEAARRDLEKIYHDHGFGTVYVDIPEQSVEGDGVVRLRVTEGRLEQVAIRGARYVSDRQIRAAVPAAEQGAVPNLPELQNQIAAVTALDAQDRTVVPVLKAGSRPGTVDLALNVQDRLPLHGSVEVNNQYTPDTAPLRAMAAMEYDNAFGRFDAVSLQYQWSPQKPGEVGVLAAGYVAHVGAGLDKLAATFINSSSSVATIGALGVIGTGQVYSLRLIHPLTVSASTQSQVSIGFDYKDYSQDVVVSETSSLSTPIRYAILSAAYNLSARERSRLWSAAATVEVGIPGLGSSPEEFEQKCDGCRPNFTLTDITAALRQQLPWGFAMVLQVAGQYTADPIIANEQFALGGAHVTRGYYEAEELADTGTRGSAELHGPNVLARFKSLSLLPFAFFDAGRIRYRQPAREQPGSLSLHSTGIGMDFGLGALLTGSLTWSDPLVDGDRTRKHDGRWEFAARSNW